MKFKAKIVIFSLILTICMVFIFQTQSDNHIITKLISPPSSTQKMTANGISFIMGSEIRANTYTSNDQQDSSVYCFADGSFVVTWEGNVQDGNGWGVFAKIFNSTGHN